MELSEAKDQIAKANGFKNWADLLVKEHLFEQYEYLHKAIDIVLSSKDKEIERLEILSKRNTDEYQKVVDEKVKEIAELKEEIERLKTGNDEVIKIAHDKFKQIQSLQEDIKNLNDIESSYKEVCGNIKIER